MTAVEPSATCRAPHVGLRFSPDGHVHACCANDTYPLGHVAQDSLRDVWQGERVAALRAALDAGDYSLGCRDCGREHALGKRTQTPAVDYDMFPQPAAPMAWPKRVEFALSNTCNLQCVHCNGDLSSSIRSQREHRPPLRSSYGDEFFAQLPELLEHVEVAVFIGGEPFLARECRRVWDLMIELGVEAEVHVTTNGTVWDDRVERYVRSLRMNVAVSMDGATAATNDAIRSGSTHREVIANRDRFLAAARSYGGGFCLNHCLMAQNWDELADFLREGDRLDVPVHVIPVMYPASMSLFALPADELAEIIETMECSRRARRLRRNRPAWDASIGHLRAHLSRLRAETARVPMETATVQPVTLALRRGAPPVDEQVERLRRDLESWAGQDAMVLRTSYGVLRAVDAPEWARFLGIEDLVGRPMDEVEALVDARLGPIVDLRPEQTSSGVTVLGHGRRVGDHDVAFRTIVVADWGVLTATPDPLHEVVGGAG